MKKNVFITCDEFYWDTESTYQMTRYIRDEVVSDPSYRDSDEFREWVDDSGYDFDLMYNMSVSDWDEFLSDDFRYYMSMYLMGVIFGSEIWNDSYGIDRDYFDDFVLVNIVENGWDIEVDVRDRDVNRMVDFVDDVLVGSFFDILVGMDNIDDRDNELVELEKILKKGEFELLNDLLYGFEYVTN